MVSIIFLSACADNDIRIEEKDKIAAFYRDMNRDKYIFGYVTEFKYDSSIDIGAKENDIESYFILRTLEGDEYIVKGFSSAPTAEIMGNGYPLKTNLLRMPKEDLEKYNFIAIVFFDKEKEPFIITKPKDIIIIPYSTSDEIERLVLENVNEMKSLSNIVINNFNSYDTVKVTNNEDAIKAVIEYKNYNDMIPNTDSYNRTYYSNDRITAVSDRIIYNTNTEDSNPYLEFDVTISGISETITGGYRVDVSGNVRIIYEYEK